LVYKNKKSGEIVKFSATSKEFKAIKNWDDWTYVSSVTKTIRETRLPSISDFNPTINVSDISEDEFAIDFIEESIRQKTVPGLRILEISTNSTIEIPLSDYSVTDYSTESYTIKDTIEIKSSSITEVDMTDFILTSKSIVIIVSRNLKDANLKEIDNLKDIQKGCVKNKIPFILICTSSRKEINEFKRKNNFYLPVFVNDEKTLKAVSRSNPALLVIENARVKAKFSYRTTPNYKWLSKNILDKK
jgi:hypothetical protein